jgi:hypothetical protein
MILKKWMPVLGKDHARTNNLERDDDSRRNHLALEDPKTVPPFPSAEVHE